MTAEHKSNIDQCKSIFITWTYAIGIIVAMAACVGTLTWQAGAMAAEINNTLEIHSTDIAKIKTDLSGIDTCIVILRELRAKP